MLSIRETYIIRKCAFCLFDQTEHNFLLKTHKMVITKNVTGHLLRKSQKSPPKKCHLMNLTTLRIVCNAAHFD